MTQSNIARYFNSQRASGWQRSCQILSRELRGIIKITFDPNPPEERDYRALVDGFSSEIQTAIVRETAADRQRAMLSLIGFLAADPSRPIASVIDDTAQILFLPRLMRDEYVHNTQIAEPYNIRKLLLEYALKARRLDDITGALTKGYCAARCDRLPTGCCSILGYDLDLVPQAMLEAQEIEARQNGWSAPPDERKCKYHTATGCTIALFKSPACIGFLCDALVEFLHQNFPASPLEQFFDNLSKLRNCYFDRTEIFETMDMTIKAGDLLLALGPDQ